MTDELKEIFDKIDMVAFHYYVASHLIEGSVNPEGLSVEKELAPDGILIKGVLKLGEDSAQYFVFRMPENELEYIEHDWLGLAAKRAAFKLRDTVFPDRFEWHLALEKKIDELEAARKK